MSSKSRSLLDVDFEFSWCFFGKESGGQKDGLTMSKMFKKLPIVARKKVRTYKHKF